MKKYIDKIFELGFGKTYNFEPFTKIIDYEKLLNKLGEKYPPECMFCAINRHIDVYTPKNHEDHRGAAAINYSNLIDFLEKLK